MSRDHVDSEGSSKISNGRKQPLLVKEPGESSRFGEVAGGTTAECAALCCCPCALVNLLALALVKLPAGLCKKAWRKAKRKHRKKNGRADGNGKQETALDLTSVPSGREELLDSGVLKGITIVEGMPVATEKFWDDFMEKVHVGFWRIPSFRE